MRKYKVYFTDDSKMQVRDLRFVQDVKIKKVKERKFLIFWKTVDWQKVLKDLGKKDIK